MNVIKLLDGLEQLLDKYRRDSHSDDGEVFILLKDKADEFGSFMLKEISEDLLAVVPSPSYCEDLGLRDKT